MEKILYSDDSMLIDESGITIHRYYFPLASGKRISYSEIRRVDVEQMNWVNGKGRVWGTADPRGWLPLDWRRHRKEKLLVFDLGRRVRPAVSPDDPRRVMSVLRDRLPDAVSS
jgi:hypothetical protein